MDAEFILTIGNAAFSVGYYTYGLFFTNDYNKKSTYIGQANWHMILAVFVNLG